MRILRDNKISFKLIIDPKSQNYIKYIDVRNYHI